ncbi:MAG: exo-alpha-sialidase, partial [Calditrichaeota bacterium]
MAQKGLVEVAPSTEVPPAIYTGSEIDALTVLIDDSPDVPVINSTTVTQSENSIFVNPLDNNKVLNSNNSTNFPVSVLYGTSGFFTTDGGLTWGGSFQGTGGSNSGDPAAAINLSGQYFVNFIASGGGQGIARSTDEGNTWQAFTVATSSGTDKNHMWVDNSPTSPYAGNLYVAYTDFNDPGANIYISRSTDNGATWSSPQNISSAINAGSHNQGVNIQTGPNGEVYVTWAVYDSWPADENALGFAVSTDGGATWSTATRIIPDIRGIRNTGTSKNHRVNSFPSMAVDITGGARNGWIYIVWPNVGVPGTNQGPDIDVYMIRSSDGGATWSSPIRVNQDPSGQGKEHYFSWITCDPETGALSVIFYDDRNVASTQCETFVANSIDGGNTWEDFKVSDVAFTPSPIPGLAGGYFGDYLGISARGSKVYPVWTDNRTGNALAYVSPFVLADPDDPNPPTGVSAYSDFTTPTEMLLTWTDPTTLVDGTPIAPSDFTIEIERDGAPLASVPGGTGTYTDMGLTDGQLYNYSLYTKLIVNDSTSTPVQVAWHAGGSPTPAAPSNLVCTPQDTTGAVLTWTDPTTQDDGTPLDDLDSIRVYRDGVHVASVAAGVGTYTDFPAPGFIYTYEVTAIDNESPVNESAPSNSAQCFVGSTPNFLVWVPSDVVGASAASGDSLFDALAANG